MQVIYIDSLFVINFILDLLILMSAAVLLKEKPGFIKCVIGALLGALYSCAAFLFEIKPILSNFLSIILFIIVSRFIFKYKNVKYFIKCAVVTVLTLTTYGGMILLLYQFTGFGAVATFNNGALYIDIPVFVLFSFSAIAYGVIWGVSRLLENRIPVNNIVKVKILLNGQEYYFKGLVDTGCNLKDPISDMPVIITNVKTFKSMIPINVFESIIGENYDNITYSWKKRIRTLPCNTINGSNMIVALKCEGVYVDFYNIGECLLAFSENVLRDTNEFELILPYTILKRKEDSNDKYGKENILSLMQANNQ